MIHPIRGARNLTRALVGVALLMVGMWALIVAMLGLCLIMVALSLAMCLMAPLALALLLVEVPVTVASLFVRGDFGWSRTLLERVVEWPPLDWVTEGMFDCADWLMDRVDGFMDLIHPLMDRALDRLEDLEVR